MKRIFYILIINILYFSCNPTRPCLDSNLIPAFTGYGNSNDFNSIIFRAYHQNGKFDQLLDTLYLTDIQPNQLISGDTLYFWLSGNTTSQNHYRVLSPGYDWEIFLPESERTFQISNIVNHQREAQGRSCLNEISSCKINGVTIYPIFSGFRIGYPRGFVVNIKYQ